MAGYPMRAIRTDRWLYIRNLEPDRWPSGCPDGSTKGWNFADCDNGPTKQFLLDQMNDPAIQPFYELAFAKRPAEELYDLQADPGQLRNLATVPAHAAVKDDLAHRLTAELTASGDPRMEGRGADLESHPFLGAMTDIPAVGGRDSGGSARERNNGSIQ